MIDIIIEISKKLPTGLVDSNAYIKLCREYEEFKQAQLEGDKLDIILEGVDCTYYAIKAHWNGQITKFERDNVILFFAELTRIPISLLLEAVIQKYTLRARPGNPKDKVFEKDQVGRLVKSWSNVPAYELGRFLRMEGNEILHTRIYLNLKEISNFIHGYMIADHSAIQDKESIIHYLDKMVKFLSLSDNLQLSTPQIEILLSLCHLLSHVKSKFENVLQHFQQGSLLPTLQTLESMRRSLNHDIFEPSKMNDYVLILITAMKGSEKLVLFQEFKNLKSQLNFIYRNIEHAGLSEPLKTAKEYYLKMFHQLFEVESLSFALYQQKTSPFNRLQYVSFDEEQGAFVLHRIKFICEIQVLAKHVTNIDLGDGFIYVKWLPISKVLSQDFKINENHIDQQIIRNRLVNYFS